MSSFEINGLTEFERDLVRLLTKRYPTEAKKFMRKQINDVKTQAKNNTPYDTGFTKAHWKTATKGKRTVSANYIESTVTNNAQLSHLLENGHRIVNQYGEWGYEPGFHMLENAVMSKDAVFAREVSNFVGEAMEELEL